MGMKDRSRSGLSKRLLRAGVQQYVAEAIAVANYPFDDPEVMAMFAPRITGQPTWAPTAAFLKAPTGPRLLELFTLIYGVDPNTYMRSPVWGAELSPAEDDDDRAYAAAKLAEREAATATPQLVLDEDGEAVVATGALRFGADREPVGQLTVVSGCDFDPDVGWVLVALALTLRALVDIEVRHRRAFAGDLARVLLRVERGLQTVDESHWQQVEEMEDETLRFAVRFEVASGSYRVDFGDYRDDEDRPAEITQRVAYLSAYSHLRDPYFEHALVYAGAHLVDRIDEKPELFDDYSRITAWAVLQVAQERYKGRVPD